MKHRHHNNNGLRRIRRGKTRRQVEEMARRLGIPYGGDTAKGGHSAARPSDTSPDDGQVAGQKALCTLADAMRGLTP